MEEKEAMVEMTTTRARGEDDRVCTIYEAIASPMDGILLAKITAAKYAIIRMVAMRMRQHAS